MLLHCHFLQIPKKHQHMRFRLTLNFEFSKYGNKIPVNYQYELSAWIYNMLAKGDLQYSNWLHENGYQNESKKFKLFTYSNILIDKAKIEDDRLVLISDHASLLLSFLPERATEEFIKGAFSSQTFTLGDRFSKVQCSIASIERLETPTYTSTMTFKTISPMVLSESLPNGKPTYISPESPNSYKLIFNNLKAKYEAFYKEQIINFNFDETANTQNFSLTAPLKRKKITIKANTPQQTFIIGYNTSFKITLPIELMKILYETGIGEKGSMGFGMVEEI